MRWVPQIPESPWGWRGRSCAFLIKGTRGEARAGNLPPGGWVDDTKCKKDIQKQVASLLWRDESLFHIIFNPDSHALLLDGKVKLTPRLNKCTNSQIKRSSQSSANLFLKRWGGKLLYYLFGGRYFDSGFVCYYAIYSIHMTQHTKVLEL